ncbi:MAG: BON domain-containing protein [Xanthomonadales bacterium]|nr:BON domain-containing protein [Xanthomonadales bacterium]
MNIKWVLSLAVLLTALSACAGTGTGRSTGEVVDDSVIATRTKSALLANSDTDGLNIDVEVDRGRVQLNGFVDSQSQIDRAGEIARDVPGAVSVENNLRVSDGGNRLAGEYIDDKAIQTKVAAALIDNPLAHKMKIDVEVNRGEVSLGGFVDSVEARDAALDTARKVNGVVKVINNLTVR